MKKILFLLLLLPIMVNATTYTAITSGNWNSTGTWDANGIPTAVVAGDVINITAGIEVKISSNTITNVTGGFVYMNVYGTLTFNMSSSQDTDLHLPTCSLVTLYSGGVIQDDGSNAHKFTHIYIGASTFWSDGNCGDDDDEENPCTHCTRKLTGYKQSCKNGCANLPVNLLYFKSSTSYNTVNFSWETTSEKNFNHFVLQISSDAKLWSDIATINGGNSLYNHQISMPLDQTYYRLAMVDLDGTVNYSSIIVININDNFSFFYDQTNKMLVIKSNDDVSKVSVFDMNGRKVVDANLNKGVNNISTASLYSGFYLVVCTNENNTVYNKVMIY